MTKYIDDKMAALEAKVDAQLEDMSGVIRGDRDQINQGFQLLNKSVQDSIKALNAKFQA